jgi:pilus assembly protein Flp/PilA
MLKSYVYLRTRASRLQDDGATAVEYGLLVAFIAFGIVVAVGFFGDALAGWFDELRGEVNSWSVNGN